MPVLKYIKNTPGRPPIGRQALSVIFFLQIYNKIPGKKKMQRGLSPPTGDRVLSPTPGATGGLSPTRGATASQVTHAAQWHADQWYRYRISSRVHILVGEQPRALKSLLVARVLKGEHAHKGEHPVAVPARDELP